ncbi:MAG TPA: TraR/DksA C4-type zinc finger protein [Jatrophihabitantaceae bacterium]|nr:TraR/DksA C4-type zinc finger protein [Jatrophihabitantaceae bacterium]
MPAKVPERVPPARKAVVRKSVTGGGSAHGSTRATRATRAVGQPDWTAAELAEIRRELAGEVVVMQDEYDRSIHDITDLQKSSTDGAGDDQADAGSKTFEREQELSIAANRLDLLTQIARAVERIDAGTYGFCESCGQPIPKARLKAFPMATLDVECKQREERR